MDEGEGLRAGGSNFATRTVHARSIMCVDAQLSDRRTVEDTAAPTFTNFTHTLHASWRGGGEGYLGTDIARL